MEATTQDRAAMLPVVNRLKGRPLGELRDQAKRVEALVASPGWGEIVALLRELQEERQQALMYGPTKEAAETYRRLGAISGLEWAIQAPEAFRLALETKTRREAAKVEAQEALR